MCIEEVVRLINTEAEARIAYIKNSPRALTWAETDELGNIRSSLRACLLRLSEYADDMPREEVITWLATEVGWDNEIIEGLF